MEETGFSFVCVPNAMDGRSKAAMCLVPALGSGYVVAYLRSLGLAAQQVVTERPLTLAACAQHVLASRPRIVGFTVHDANCSLSLQLAAEIKRLDRSVIVVFGGATPTANPSTLLEKNAWVDLCVRGAGEETAVELVAKLEASGYRIREQDLRDVEGISFRAGDGVIVNPERRVFQTNSGVRDFLDRYPSPLLTGVIDASVGGIVTSRGCSQHCTYCNCAVLSERRVLYHSVDRVVEELQYLAEEAVRHDGLIMIFDDTFTFNRKRTVAICQRLIEAGIRLPLGCATRCDTVDHELLELMKEAGVTYIGFSLESAVPRVLRAIGKVQHPLTKSDDDFSREKLFIEKLRDNVAHAKRIGIEVSASIMTGIPGESLDDARETIRVVESLDLDMYAHNVLVANPGTPMFRDRATLPLKTTETGNGLVFAKLDSWNTREAAPGRRSIIEQMVSQNRAEDTRILSLPVSENPTMTCVHSVVVFSGSIDEELIAWLRDNLALNGRLVQVYSSPDVAIKQLESVRRMLLDSALPTTNYYAYVLEAEGPYASCLIPVSSHEWGERCLKPIPIVDSGFTQSLAGDDERQLSALLHEQTAGDTEAVHDLLLDLAELEPDLEESGALVLPYFHQLCRWKRGPANCKTLATLFVDAAGKIRTCLNGEAIGKVGDSLSSLARARDAIAARNREERGCATCARATTCSQCLFPNPLPADQLCDRVINHDVTTALDIIAANETLKQQVLPIWSP